MKPAEARALAKKANEVGDVAELDDIREYVDDEFEDLVEEFDKLSLQKTDIETRLDELKPIIEAAWTMGGMKFLRVAGRYIKQGKGRSPDRIDKKRLIEQGVKTDVIEKATIRGKPFTYPQIDRTK